MMSILSYLISVHPIERHPNSQSKRLELRDVGLGGRDPITADGWTHWPGGRFNDFPSVKNAGCYKRIASYSILYHSDGGCFGRRLGSRRQLRAGYLELFTLH